MNFTDLFLSVFDKVENIVGKGKNIGYEHVLLFSLCCQKASSLGVVQTRERVKFISELCVKGEEMWEK